MTPSSRWVTEPGKCGWALGLGALGRVPRLRPPCGCTMAGWRAEEQRLPGACAGPGERAGKCGWIEEVGRGVLAGRILSGTESQDGGWCLVMTGCRCYPVRLLKMGVSGLSQSLPGKDRDWCLPRGTGAPPPEGPGPGGTIRRQEAQGTASESELRGLRRWEGKGCEGRGAVRGRGNPCPAPVQSPGGEGVQRLGSKVRGEWARAQG